MEYIAGIVVTVLLALLAVVWNLLNEKIERNKTECEERDKRIWDQLGRDSQSGMRFDVHAAHGLPAAFVDLDRRVMEMERTQRGGDR